MNIDLFIKACDDFIEKYDILKAKYISRTGSPGNYKYVYPGGKNSGKTKKELENKPSSVTNKKETEGKKMSIKLDHSGESEIFEVKGEKVFFRKDDKSSNIVLADANTGEPVLSGTNQYLKFDSIDSASDWLLRNTKKETGDNKMEVVEHSIDEIWSAYSKEELTPKKGESYEDVAKRIIKEAGENNAVIVGRNGDHLDSLDLSSLIKDKVG